MKEHLLNFMCFPDLTQGEATINEKNLLVEKDTATLEDKAEIKRIDDLIEWIEVKSSLIYDFENKCLDFGKIRKFYRKFLMAH